MNPYWEGLRSRRPTIFSTESLRVPYSRNTSENISTICTGGMILQNEIVKILVFSLFFDADEPILGGLEVVGGNNIQHGVTLGSRETFPKI